MMTATELGRGLLALQKVFDGVKIAHATLFSEADKAIVRAGSGVGRTIHGDIIPAEIVRRMCTNANIVRLLTSDSRPIDIGLAKRLATDDQYRALVARDGGCRMPGCNIPASWCQVDHIQEWDAQNGPTDLDWLVLWCIYHHSFRHRPDVHLHGDANNCRSQCPTGEPSHSPPADPPATKQPPNRRAHPEREVDPGSRCVPTR